MKGSCIVIILCLCLASCGEEDSAPTSPTSQPTPSSQPTGDNAPTSSTSQPTPSSQPMFTLTASDCHFSFSRPIITLSRGESFDVRFTPLRIKGGENPDSSWANTVEFWFDWTDQDAIGLSLEWLFDSTWVVASFTVKDGFRDTGDFIEIELRGDFHTISFVRRNKGSEWFFDGVKILRLPDQRPRRTVYTRVVGAKAEFEFDLPGSSSRTLPLDDWPSDLPCGTCATK